MEPIKVLVVDDEPLARDIMETYIHKIGGLELAGKCRNALEAFSFLGKSKADLMLLDINMPEINGIDFLRSLKNPPYVIFTTAYSEFAVASYELEAIDYLLKPVSFDRFLKAINKVTDIMQAFSKINTAPVAAADLHGDGMIFVKSEGKLIKVELAKLWFVEGLKDYVRLWTDNGKIIVHNTMKNFEEFLSGQPAFVRVNKSFIINLKHVSELYGNAIKIKDQEIIIGNTYRDEIKELFDKMKLL